MDWFERDDYYSAKVPRVRKLGRGAYIRTSRRGSDSLRMRGTADWGMRQRRRAAAGAGWLALVLLAAALAVAAVLAVPGVRTESSFVPMRGNVLQDADAFQSQVMQVVQAIRPAVVSIIVTDDPSPGGASGGSSSNAPGKNANAGSSGGEGVDAGVKPGVSGRGASGNSSAASTTLGSGVVFQLTGGKARIVTNNHVVAGGSRVEVQFLDGTRRTAKVVGTDVMSDLAVLEVNGAGITHYATFGNSDTLQTGQTAIAVGNPLGLGETVTVGVISSPHRLIPQAVGTVGNVSKGPDIDLIQTDAAINEGNSGGALVNLDGQVIGINSRKVEGTGVEGLGFAIPINQVKTVVDSLVRHGRVIRPMLGVATVNLSAEPKVIRTLKLPAAVKDGALVVQVSNPAKTAGIATNDVIVRLDNQPVNTTYELRQYLYQHKKVGDSMKVTFYRGGKLQSVIVKLGELPPDGQP